MSKLTDILGLFKYDPETDGANTFNITQALNNNWDKIDQLVLLAVAAAAAYDPEGSYAVGDYCTHGGKLHKCSTDIPSGEPWNAEHWTETTVAAELAEVRASLSNKVNKQYPYTSDAHTIGIGQFYWCDQNTDNTPYKAGLTSAQQGIALCTAGNATENWCTLLYITHAQSEMFIQSRVGEWNKWIPFSLATPPQEHAIVPKNGATLIEGFKNSYSKDQFGRVLAFFSLNFSNVPEVNLEIFSLPESFTPTTGTVAGAATLIAAGNYYPATVNAYTNGVVSVNHDAPISSTSTNLHGFLVIDTGGTQ